MTPEQAKKLMTVLQWIVDGKEVEARLPLANALSNNWQKIIGCTYLDALLEYRLKPREPLEGWANIYSTGGPAALFRSLKEARVSQNFHKFPYYLRTAKFREVVEDDSPTREDDSDG